MDTKDILLRLRTEKGLSQDELAEKIYVTRQAVSRWENGDTVPGVETLKLLSKFFDVSINTLLGSPRQLICQCCGMPLEDPVISREPDGGFNEEYCRWCYTDGGYVYENMDELIDFLAGHMSGDAFAPEQVRAHMRQLLPKLDHWKRYAALGGREGVDAFASELSEELSALRIEGMPPVKRLYPLKGSTVNHAYRLPDGSSVRFLNDDAVYLGIRLPCEFGPGHFGIVAGMDFLLVYADYENAAAPELLLYRKR
ncbi:MAG: helix-turn-helix domain-containing protein [Oscillospiraceae bacterium]|nr:helix-turn-helix domain-containing protein [Oscillospiraceae bacterium]